MGRKYDLVDVMAATGLVATLLGGYLLVTAADGFWQAPSTPRMSTAIAGTDPAAGMQYLQPVLGQAIVQDLLLDREAEAVLSASSMELNRAVVESQAMETSILSPLVVAELRAYGQDVDHRARMQYVMGKSVVNQTRRGIFSGTLSVEQYGGEFNRNLIRTAELTGQRMHDEFVATRQAALGRSIVDAIVDEERMTGVAALRVRGHVQRGVEAEVDRAERREAARAAAHLFEPAALELRGRKAPRDREAAEIDRPGVGAQLVRRERAIEQVAAAIDRDQRAGQRRRGATFRHGGRWSPRGSRIG